MRKICLFIMFASTATSALVIKRLPGPLICCVLFFGIKKEEIDKYNIHHSLSAKQTRIFLAKILMCAIFTVINAAYSKTRQQYWLYAAAFILILSLHPTPLTLHLQDPITGKTVSAATTDYVSANTFYSLVKKFEEKPENDESAIIERVTPQKLEENAANKHQRSC
jgi:hypothetical protein